MRVQTTLGEVSNRYDYVWLMLEVKCDTFYIVYVLSRFNGGSLVWKNNAEIEVRNGLRLNFRKLLLRNDNRLNALCLNLGAWMI